MLSERLDVDGEKYGTKAWHLWLKSRFLGCDDMVLPNGATITVPHSSADLDTAEFGDYMAQVEAWAAERGVWLDE